MDQNTCHKCDTQYDPTYMACPECGFIQPDDDCRMDWAPADLDGLSLSDQYPDEFDYEAFEEDLRDTAGEEPEPISSHHPDCQCARCYYGEDLYRFHFHPSEY